MLLYSFRGEVSPIPSWVALNAQDPRPPNCPPANCLNYSRKIGRPYLHSAPQRHLRCVCMSCYKNASLLSVPATTKELGLSQPTVAKAMELLEKLGAVREITAKQRRRVYAYVRYLDILNQGTEAPVA